MESTFERVPQRDLLDPAQQPRRIGLIYQKTFIVFLYEHGYLKDFVITRTEAEELYNSSFRYQYESPPSFGDVMMCDSKLYQEPPQNQDHFRIKEDKLQEWLEQKEETESDFELLITSQKKIMVSHDYVYRPEMGNLEQGTMGTMCNLCNLKLADDDALRVHVEERRHKFIHDFREAVRRGLQPPRDVGFWIKGHTSVSNIIVRENKTATIQLSILSLENIIYDVIQIEWDCHEKDIRLERPPDFPWLLHPDNALVLKLTIQPQPGGTKTFPMFITLKRWSNHTVKIPMELVCHFHSEMFDCLHPVKPLKRRKRYAVEMPQNIERGIRPDRTLSYFIYKIDLGMYEFPNEISHLINAGLREFPGMTYMHSIYLDELRNVLDVPERNRAMTEENYSEVMKVLLYIEEDQMKKDIRDYDRDDAILKRPLRSTLLELEVPGLAESRPSLIRGDSVYVRESPDSPCVYEGVVHSIENTKVKLGFSSRFINSVFIPNRTFYISFGYNRLTIRVEHQAIQYADEHRLAPVFFPLEISSDPCDPLEIEWHNRNLENNPRQQQAVRAILNKSSKPHPYLIFGPPGTGKTMTVIEAVTQIYKRTQEYVLVCAPSNNAANEVAKRLVNGVPASDMMRYMSYSFPRALIPDEIQQFINYRYAEYYHPSIEDLMKKRILITTLVTAARLLNGGVPSNHFGYIFVDESGQATESMTLIPIAGIASCAEEPGELSAQVVLAGDPKQLGAITHSYLAKEYGFDRSMLERLMTTNAVYQKDEHGAYNPNAVTKLLKNYRSHSSIIAKSNEYFYDNELQAAGDHLINLALGWDGLPNPNFPMIFHSVLRGIDQREGNSPSYFNIQEIQVVMYYLQQLIGTRMKGRLIGPQDIAVISPYRKQVQKITKMCQHYDGLTVGSVEQLQGQERLIVIVSTVRSRSDFLQIDHRFHLGFVKNPKRFNVALSRAKALFIAIGNPHLLQHDQHWRGLIAYCRENGATRGDKFDLLAQDVEEPLAEIIEPAEELLMNDEERPEKAVFARGEA